VHRDWIALFVCASLFALQSKSLAFHTHAVGAHGHGAHHHGPAIHPHATFDRDLHIDAPDASSGRILTVAVPTGIGSTVVAVDAQMAEAFVAPELRAIGETLTVDVRSHGPPPPGEHSLRGPPFPHSL
jgi:hypothetical protein